MIRFYIHSLGQFLVPLLMNTGQGGGVPGWRGERQNMAQGAKLGTQDELCSIQYYSRIHPP